MRSRERSLSQRLCDLCPSPRCAVLGIRTVDLLADADGSVLPGFLEGALDGSSALGGLANEDGVELQIETQTESRTQFEIGGRTHDSIEDVPRRSGGKAQPESHIDYRHDYGHERIMNTVSKSALKAKMLEYFRRVEETHEELIVTDNNRPVLRILPIQQRRSAADVFADVRGRVVYHEDILAPTIDEWPEP